MNKEQKDYKIFTLTKLIIFFILYKNNNFRGLQLRPTIGLGSKFIKIKTKEAHNLKKS